MSRLHRIPSPTLSIAGVFASLVARTTPYRRRSAYSGSRPSTLSRSVRLVESVHLGRHRLLKLTTVIDRPIVGALITRERAPERRGKADRSTSPQRRMRQARGGMTRPRSEPLLMRSQNGPWRNRTRGNRGLANGGIGLTRKGGRHRILAVVDGVARTGGPRMDGGLRDIHGRIGLNATSHSNGARPAIAKGGQP